MNEQNKKVDGTSTGLLASLAEECRKMIDASGLDGGQGGGWKKYDGQMVELRKRLKKAEAHLDDIKKLTKKWGLTSS